MVGLAFLRHGVGFSFQRGSFPKTPMSEDVWSGLYLCYFAYLQKTHFSKMFAKGEMMLAVHKWHVLHKFTNGIIVSFLLCYTHMYMHVL